MKLPVFNYDQLVSKSEAGQKVFHQGVFKPIDLSCLIETLVVPKSKKQRMPWIKSILFRFYCILLEKPFRDDDKKSLQYIRDLPDNEAYKLIGNLIVKKEEEHRRLYVPSRRSLSKMQLQYISFQWFSGLVQLSEPVLSGGITVGPIQRTRKINVQYRCLKGKDRATQMTELNRLRFKVGCLMDEINENLHYNRNFDSVNTGLN